MKKITAKEAAEKWGISLRRVQDLCRMGKIHGAQRFGKSWVIPADERRPLDGRSKAVKRAGVQAMPVPRRSPMLVMTDLYHTPGQADKDAEDLVSNPGAKLLFDAGIAYSRGQIHKAREYAQQVLDTYPGYFAVEGAALQIALCAIWLGDVELWNHAKRCVVKAPIRSETDQEIVSLISAAAGSSIYANVKFPDWFDRGCFYHLPPESHPMAKTFYAKYLYMAAFGVASKQLVLEGIQGLALMRILHNTLEPMIAQAIADKTVIPEICLRLYCAVAYHNTGRTELAAEHVDKAIALALPDRLYGLLAEHWRLLDGLLESRIALMDPGALKTIKDLHRQFSAGQAALGSVLRNRKIAMNLTDREREIAKLVAFGFTNKKIAGTLNISESTVKTTVQNIMLKTGMTARTDFVFVL